MGNFNRDNRYGGGRDFNRRDFGDRGGRPQMNKAICDKCGKECEVPFRPTGSKPVYCSDCFRTIGGGSDSRRFPERSPNKNNYGERSTDQNQYYKQFEALNAKLDKILKLLSPTTSLKIAQKTNQPKELVNVIKKEKKVSKKITPELSVQS